MTLEFECWIKGRAGLECPLSQQGVNPGLRTQRMGARERAEQLRERQRCCMLAVPLHNTSSAGYGKRIEDGRVALQTDWGLDHLRAVYDV